jgi:hypothetical protein
MFLKLVDKNNRSEIPVKIDFFIEIYHENVLNSHTYKFDGYSEEAFQMDNIRSVFMKCIKNKICPNLHVN